MAEDDFPLGGWFDTSKRISRDQRLEAEEQIKWYAWKNSGGEPSAEDQQNIRRTCWQLRQAVKAHNAKMAATR